MIEGKKYELKLSFFLNAMGIWNNCWYEENKIPYTERMSTSTLFPPKLLREYDTYYYAGRIDVHGHPEFPFNYEYSVEIMDGQSWNMFGNWLDELILNYLPDKVEELYQMYEQETGNKINWWKSNDN